MNDTSKHRHRRRAGYHFGRHKPSISPARLGLSGLAACAAVVIVAVALSVLTWIVTARTVQEQRIAVRQRSEQIVLGQAATMAETVAHELLVIDQSLTIIQAAWKADSSTLDLAKWQDEMPALTAVADDLFIADETSSARTSCRKPWGRVSARRM
jgi:hypothetical protein